MRASGGGVSRFISLTRSKQGTAAFTVAGTVRQDLRCEPVWFLPLRYSLVAIRGLFVVRNTPLTINWSSKDPRNTQRHLMYPNIQNKHTYTAPKHPNIQTSEHLKSPKTQISKYPKLQIYPKTQKTKDPKIKAQISKDPKVQWLSRDGWNRFAREPPWIHRFNYTEMRRYKQRCKGTNIQIYTDTKIHKDTKIQRYNEQRYNEQRCKDTKT